MPSDIAAVTEERTMPPWHASTTEGGPFRDARVLTDAEIEDPRRLGRRRAARRATRRTARRRESGAPTGRSARPTWSSRCPSRTSWGPPGADEYRVFVIPSGLTEGRWIAAVDFRPGNPKVVHHILAAYDVTGQRPEAGRGRPGPRLHDIGRRLRPAPERPAVLPSGQLWGWAPRQAAELLAEGVAPVLAGRRRRPAPGPLPQERQGRDRPPAIGLYFAKGPVDKQIRGRHRDARRARGFFAQPDADAFPPGERITR